jgi:putative peptidoglycan lipid II flippase
VSESESDSDPDAAGAPPPTNKRGIVRTALLLLPVHVVFRAGEAVLPLLLAAWFGRSDATDVYYFSWAVFSFAGSLVFSAYQDSALVPILAEVKIQERALLPKVIGSLLTYTVLLGSGLAAAIGLIALGYFRARYHGADFAVAARMVVPFSVFLVLLSVKTYFVALLNSEHRYFAQPVASSVGIVANIGFIAMMRGTQGVLAIPIGALLGEICAIAILSFVAIGLVKMRFTLTLERPAPVVRFTKLIASEVGGGAVTRVNPVVDQLMAGLAGVVGGGTMLRYTGDVASLPTSLLQATLLPVLLSHLAEDFAEGKIDKIRATVSRSLLSVCTILLAMSAILYALRAPILRFVFLRGEMDIGGVERMIAILPYHLVGLAPFGALLVLARAHVAVKNSGIMISMGILNAALNAVFNVVLMKAIGLEGIALSTSCVQLAIAIVFWFRLEAKLAPLASRPA